MQNSLFLEDFCILMLAYFHYFSHLLSQCSSNERCFLHLCWKIFHFCWNFPFSGYFKGTFFFFWSSVHRSFFQEFWLSFQFLSVVFHRSMIPDYVWMGYCSKVTFSWEIVTFTTCNRCTVNGMVLSILMISSGAIIFNRREGSFFFNSKILESRVNFYFQFCYAFLALKLSQ